MVYLLVTEHSVLKVRHLSKLMAVFLAEFFRLLFVLQHMACPCRLCDNASWAILCHCHGCRKWSLWPPQEEEAETTRTAVSSSAISPQEIATKVEILVYDIIEIDIIRLPHAHSLFVGCVVAIEMTILTSLTC